MKLNFLYDQRICERSGGGYDERGHVEEKSEFKMDSPKRQMQGKMTGRKENEENKQRTTEQRRKEEGLKRMGDNVELSESEEEGVK